MDKHMIDEFMRKMFGRPIVPQIDDIVVRDDRFGAFADMVADRWYTDDDGLYRMDLTDGQKGVYLLLYDDCDPEDCIIPDGFDAVIRFVNGNYAGVKE